MILELGSVENKRARMVRDRSGALFQTRVFQRRVRPVPRVVLAPR